MRETLAPQPGERVLDVGCGPGFYCVELAAEVGPSGSVVGLDGSEAMLELAGRRCAELGNVELRVGDATALSVADADFDAAICVQVLEYVPDARAGLAELHRALKPGGRVLVWDIDWATFSMQGDELTRRVQAAWDEHLTHVSLPRVLAPALRAVGFEARAGAGAPARHDRVRPRDLRRLARAVHRRVRRRSGGRRCG